MTVTDKLWNWIEGYAIGVSHYYCENCEETMSEADEHCPACGSELTVVEVVPEYGFGPMY